MIWIRRLQIDQGISVPFDAFECSGIVDVLLLELIMNLLSLLQGLT